MLIIISSLSQHRISNRWPLRIRITVLTPCLFNRTSLIKAVDALGFSAKNAKFLFILISAFMSQVFGKYSLINIPKTSFSVVSLLYFQK